jgi:hypothetical protein
LSSTDSSRLLGTTISVSTSAAERLDPGLGLVRARALEAERLGHDADRQRADLARDPRDDGRRAGAGAAALAGRDEDHVRALQQRLDLVVLLHRRQAPSSAFAPDPSPRVTCAPMWTVTSAVHCCSDCTSVLIAMNSTPGDPPRSSG